MGTPSTKFFFTVLCMLLLSWSTEAQQPSLQDAMLKPLRGPMASFGTITARDSLVLICFWSSASEESIDELNAINTHWINWQKEVHFRLIAVAVNEGKASGRVRAVALGNGWLFDVFEDLNDELKRATGIKTLPVALLVKNGKVLYQQSGFTNRSENYLIEKIRQLH